MEGLQKRNLSVEESYSWMKHERCQGAQREWDLRPGSDTGALLYQLSYEALISPVRSSGLAIMCSEWRDEYMRKDTCMNCGFKMTEEWNNPRGFLWTLVCSGNPTHDYSSCAQMFDFCCSFEVVFFFRVRKQLLKLRTH